MSEAFATMGTTLKLDDIEVTGIQSIGDPQTAASAIDVTTLKDNHLVSIPGLRQDSAIAVVVFKDKTAGGGNYEQVKALDDGDDHIALLTFADGSTLQFPARVSVTLNGTAIAAAQQFTITLFKSGDDTYTPAPSAGV